MCHEITNICDQFLLRNVLVDGYARYYRVFIFFSFLKTFIAKHRAQLLQRCHKTFINHAHGQQSMMSYDKRRGEQVDKGC